MHDQYLRVLVVPSLLSSFLCRESARVREKERERAREESARERERADTHAFADKLYWCVKSVGRWLSSSALDSASTRVFILHTHPKGLHAPARVFHWFTTHCCAASHRRLKLAVRVHHLTPNLTSAPHKRGKRTTAPPSSGTSIIEASTKTEQNIQHRK